MKKLTWLFLFFFLQLSAIGSRGDSDSAGGDNLDWHSDSAWFLGQRKIRYCILRSDDFGPSLTEIQTNLDSAFKIWREYIFAKKIYQNSEVTKRLAVNEIRLETCDGSQDLTFYLGIENQNIANEKAKYHNPSAFVFRESFEIKKGWSKGYIWVASSGKVFPSLGFPHWEKPGTLIGILLHELGHIYGNSHVEKTIMTSRISQLLQYDERNEKQKERLSKIDHEKELRVCLSCLAIYRGTVSKEAFKFLFEREPSGSIVGELKRDGLKFDLTVADDVDSMTFSFLRNFGPTLSFDGPVIFKVVSAAGSQTINHGRYVFNGRIKTKSGKEVSTVGAINESEQISFFYDSEGMTRKLFSSEGDLK